MSNSFNKQSATGRIVLGEIANVLASMRQSNKWDERTKMASSPLVRSLEQLSHKIESIPDRVIFNMETIDYLRPFLDVIKSGETSGPITAVALSSIHKFIYSGLIGSDAVKPAKGICSIVTDVAHCRFEATDSTTDEVVLMKILNVLLACLQSSSGHLLSNKLVYELIQTCFKMSTQSRLSVLLRKSAEMVLVDMVHHIFSRFYALAIKHDSQEISEHPPPKATRSASSPSLDLGKLPTNGSTPDGLGNLSIHLETPENREELSTTSEFPISIPSSPQLERPTDSSQPETTENKEEEGPRQTPRQTGADGSDLGTGEDNSKDEESVQDSNLENKELKLSNGSANEDKSDSKKKEKYVNAQGITFARWNEVEEKRPFSSRVLIKLLSFFCSLINPNDTKKTISVRILGLNLLNTVIESQGPSFTELPQLLNFVCNDMCKYLMQAYQKIKKDETPILNLILRICYNLFTSLGGQLKFQLDVFLRFSLKLLNDEQTLVEQRELILETIIQLLREPSFAVDLYINYDCDTQSDNVFGNLIEFFYKNSASRDDKANDRFLYIRSLSLGAFAAILQSICQRMKMPKVLPMADLDPSSLATRQHTKTMLIQAAEQFSINPQQCFEFLQGKKLLPTILDPSSVAVFLRNNKFLNKAKIGEYIGKNKEFNEKVLEEYIKTFDFTGKNFLQCFRDYIESFQPLGESQVIERYLDKFIRHYLKCFDGKLDGIEVGVDPLFTLSYSIIMLNVDLHSPVLADRPKMTIQQYTNNLRNLNNGQDFPREYLVNLYETVLKDEIKVHKEHLNNNSLTDSTWNHLIRDSIAEHQEQLILTKDSATNYDPLLFDKIWRKVIPATKFVFSTTKSQEVLEKTLNNFQMCALIASHYKLTHAFDSLIITLCDLTSVTQISTDKFFVTFGRNNKAHVAILALFTIVKKYGDHLRESWKNVLSCLVKLHSVKLLPLMTTFQDIFTFQDEHVVPVAPTESQSFGALAFGFLQGTSSWLMGSGEDQNTETAEKKFKEETEKIINQCNLSELLQFTCNLAPESLLFLVKAIISAFQSFQTPQPQTKQTGTENKDKVNPSVALLYLDLLTELTRNNKHRISTIWQYVVDHLEAVVTSRTNDFDTIYKALTNLLVLSMTTLSLDVKDIRHSTLQILIRATLRDFPNNTFQTNKFRKKLSVGINKILNSNLEHFNSQQDWEDTVELLKWTFKQPDTLKDGFSVLYYAVSSQSLDGTYKSPISTFITKENFSLFYELIGDIVNKQTTENTFYTIKCIELLQHIVTVIPQFYSDKEGEESLEEKEAIQLYWIPTFQYLCILCRDHRTDVQNNAMSSLQRALLAQELFLLSPASWSSILEKVLFPLLTELLRSSSLSESLSTDAVEEVRLRAANILCKTFLQYLSKIIAFNEFNNLWIKILSFIKLYMNVDKSEVLSEAVSEALKNILMVMHASGILRPSNPAATYEDEEEINENKKKDELWEITWKQIDLFCPNLRNDFTNIVAANKQRSLKNLETANPVTTVQSSEISAAISTAQPSEISGVAQTE